MTRTFIHIFTLILSLSALTSCLSDKGHDGPVDMTYADIATFQGNINGRAQFTIRQVNDLPEATLIAQAPLNYNPEDDPTGKRMFIRYTPESKKPYVSGPMTLLSAATVNQSATKIENISDYPDWGRDKVYLYTVWRTGKYLNFNVSLTYDSEPRVFCIVADKSTLSNDYPDLYLVHIMKEPTDYHDRRYYASFDISEIWDRENILGVNLHVCNSNLNKDIFTFDKTL